MELPRGSRFGGGRLGVPDEGATDSVHFLWSAAGARTSARAYARPMRRLVTLVCIVVFTDTMLFGALVPLIPDYADNLDLSKSQAGLLLGAYGAGALAGGIPSGLFAARIGPRRSMVVGLALLGVTTILFALASAAPVLGAARFGQGFASALAWTGALSLVTLETDRERRGEILGTIFSFAILGYILGPMVGAAAELTSIRVTFCAVAVGAFALAGLAARVPTTRPPLRDANPVARALTDPRFIGGLWITFLPALFFGVLEILTPLRLADAGWGAVAIASVFVVSGLLEVMTSPLVGRLSDRRGRSYPVRLALIGSIATATLIAFAHEPAMLVPLVFLSAFTFGWFSTPGMALVADRAERAHIPQSLAFGIMNTAWAFGAMIGPALGAALAHAFSDAVPYLACAILCGATLIGLQKLRARPQAAP